MKSWRMVLMLLCTSLMALAADYPAQEGTFVDLRGYGHYDAGWIARWKFGRAKNDNGSPEAAWYAEITVRYWLILLLTSILPAYWFARCRRASNAPGTCPHCGYDLRATPQRCPECGQTPLQIAACSR